MDFEFVIDDHTTYYLMSDFQIRKAKPLFQRYQQLEKDYYQQEEKLNGLRQQYAGANQQGKGKTGSCHSRPRKADTAND